MSKHGTSPEFERKLQDLAARTAHMIIPRSNVERPWSEMAFPEAPPESEPSQVIPEAAVEAAACWLPHSGDCEVRPERDCTCWKSRVDLMRAALEAAAPHMLSHEWEETGLARLDAVVNADTADRLEAKLDRVEALANTWWANFPSKARAVLDAIKD